MTLNANKHIIFEDVGATVGASDVKKLHILHFGDVYNIEGQHSDPVGGAARFCTVLEALKNESTLPTLVLFSGDAISPSARNNLVI